MEKNDYSLRKKLKLGGKKGTTLELDLELQV